MADPGATGPAPERLQVVPVVGVGEVRPGDDLAGLLVAGLTGAGERLSAGDVLVVSSKVVSKAEGRVVPGLDREAQIEAQTVRVVAARRTRRGTARVVQAAAGPVMAAAGVDASNVAAGTVLLLPADPDASARALRARLHELAPVAAPGVGVVVSDTAGRAWRDGQTDFALGAAGITVTEDLRGATDTAGQPLEVTVRAVADELAAAADLVKGKLSGWPAALLRGLPQVVTEADGPGAAVLLRRAADDWFRLGHVEAVRAGLGVVTGTGPGEVEPPTVPAGDLPSRLARALDVAQLARTLDVAQLARAPDLAELDPPPLLRRHLEGGRATLTLEVAAPDGGPGEPAVWFHAGVLAERIRVAAWSEDLAVIVTVTAGPPPSLIITATPASG